MSLWPKQASVFLLCQKRESFWLSHSKWVENFPLPVADHALHTLNATQKSFTLFSMDTCRQMGVYSAHVCSWAKVSELSQCQAKLHIFCEEVKFIISGSEWHWQNLIVLSAECLVRVSGHWTGTYIIYVFCVTMWLSGWRRVLHLVISSRIYKAFITLAIQIIFLLLYEYPGLVLWKPKIVTLFKFIASLSAHYFQHLVSNAWQ